MRKLRHRLNNLPRTNQLIKGKTMFDLWSLTPWLMIITFILHCCNINVIHKQYPSPPLVSFGKNALPTCSTQILEKK